MREIKFRAISTHSGQFVYGNFIHSKRFKGCGNEFRIHESESGIESDVIPETVGQFTGMTDKNGVEIYEGDKIIFGNPRITQVVVFRNGQFMAQQLKGSYIGLAYCNWETCSEVIGNVHETQTA